MNNNNSEDYCKNPEFLEVDHNYFDNLSDFTAVRTHVWGPPAWFFLHSMAMAYPKKIDNTNDNHKRIKNSMGLFLKHLGDVLPCSICSESYNNYIKESLYDIDKYLDSRAKLAYFIYLIHDRVNKKLGVPQCYRPSFKKVIKKYGKFLVGQDQCKLTNIEHKTKNLLKDCDSQKRNMDFKKYKSIVTVIDKDTNKIEKFEIEDDFKGFNTPNVGFNVVLIFLIIFVILTICLFCNQLKK